MVGKIFLGNMYDCRIAVGVKEIRVHAGKTLKAEVGQPIYLAIDPERCLCIME
jgi:hypothetical protein